MKISKIIIVSLSSMMVCVSSFSLMMINKTKSEINVIAGITEYKNEKSSIGTKTVTNSYFSATDNKKIAKDAQADIKFENSNKNASLGIFQGNIYASISANTMPWGEPWIFNSNGSKLKADCDFTGDNPQCKISE